MAKTLKEIYNEQIRTKLREQLSIKNELEIPKLEKIVINMGLGDEASNGKALDAALKELETIAGQKPVITRSKKSIAGFKIRQGQALGIKVTLRKDRMYHFFSKLVNIAMPRIRDFQGVPAKFDSKGNFTYGVKEQLIFPEINFDKVGAIHGMDISFVTSAKSDEHGKALLEMLGMPFKKPRNQKPVAA